MNIIYCSECCEMEKVKSGSGFRFHCKKQDKYLPINTTDKDIETMYCVDGKLPRKEHNTRCNNNTW